MAGQASQKEGRNCYTHLFKEVKQKEPLVLPKTSSRLETLILWWKVVKTKQKGRPASTLSFWVCTLSLSLSTKGYPTQASLSLPPSPTLWPSGPGWKSTEKPKYCAREGIPMAKNYIEKTRPPSTRIFLSISLIIKGPRSDDFSEWCLEIDQTQQPSQKTRVLS